MRLLDTRILCVGLLILCTAGGCKSRYGSHRPHCLSRVGQCGQGHSSLMEWYLCRKHGHAPCADPCAGAPCAEGQCDSDCYQRPLPPPVTEPTPAPPPESTTRIIRPRRRWVDRSGDTLKFSIPLPSRWIGNTEPAAEISEPAEEIPWNNAPVATSSPTRSNAVQQPEAPQVVGYEYRLPVELQAPRFE